MTGAAATLERVVAALESAGADHMIVGSFASTFHGEPRSTQDIDMVVSVDAAQLEGFLDALPDGEWYVDRETARDALRRRSIFNVIHFETGWKVDVIALKDDVFSRSQFDRRVEVTLLGTRVCVATAEDTVLSKLVWARAGGSERQLRDVAGIVAVTGGDLDLEYIDRWAAELRVDEAWTQVRGAADDS